MIRAVFCDLDGTLFNSHHEISKEDLDAIKEATEKGILFVPCTGRVPYTLGNDLDIISFAGKHMIGDSGAVLIDEGEPFCISYLKPVVKKAVKDYALANSCCLEIFTIRDEYVFHGERYTGTRAKFINQCGHQIGDDEIEEVMAMDIAKINFVNEDDSVSLKIKNELLENHGDILEAYHSFVFLEIGNKGIDKAWGIREFCDRKGIDIANTIGIGDTNNDSPMLEVVGISACPSNAQQIVKDACTYVSPSSNNESAVSEIIRRFAL